MPPIPSCYRTHARPADWLAPLTAIFLTLWLSDAIAAPWTYRGTLDDAGKPANGLYDLRLTLLDEAGQSPVSQPLTLYGVAVRDGNFAAEVDFGIDLSHAPVLQLRSEVQQGSSGFVVLGEPTRFDAKVALVGVCWDTEGNAGTNPASNFIGTTDNQPLVLRTRNTQSLRIEPSDLLFAGLPVTRNMIGGSHVNGVSPSVRGAAIGGGGAPTGGDPSYLIVAPNRVLDDYGTVGGGVGSQAGRFAAVGGGAENAATGIGSGVGGGISNTASGTGSTVAGGDRNMASGSESTVAGGFANLASGFQSSVGAGSRNTAAGDFSALAGGSSNCAGGDYSWSGGRLSKVRQPGDRPLEGSCTVNSGDSDGDEGTFMWADSRAASFVSTGPDQFLVRSEGGAVFQRAVNGETSARSPRGFFNVVRGSSGITQATSTSSTTVASFESNTSAFVRIFSPDASESGVLFANASNVSDAGIVYSNLSGNLDFRNSGNTTQMRISANGLVSFANLTGAGTTSLCRNGLNQLSNCSSSARYKDRIEDLNMGLDAVAQLRPVGYHWKTDGSADVGFIAEEVARLDERLVTRNDQGQIEGVKYDRLSVVLAGALQELAARQAQLESRLQALEQKLAP